MKSLKNIILDILFPEHCLGCRKSGTLLCALCISHIPEAHDPEIAWALSVYDYRDPLVRRAIWELKYKNGKGLADIFGAILADHIFEEIADLALFSGRNKITLVSIPSTVAHKRKRGYNQSELLARAITRTNSEYEFTEGLLIKTRETVPQARVRSRRERLSNLVGSFSVRDPDLILGKTVILIDDVTTTGATLKEARRALKESGAKKVLAYTIAH